MWPLALLGCGTGTDSRPPREEPEPPAALLFLSPSSLTFGTESSAQVLTLRSIGELPVNLESVWIEGAAVFSLTDPGPLTLEPRDEVEVTVTFTASGVEESGSVEIASDAEYAPHSVPLVGGILGPQAVCSADPPTIAPLDGVSLLGDTSYDPSGRTLTDYDWALLERPEASLARLASGGANRSFQPDLAGTYVFELVVTNDAGLMSDPCTVAVEVIPTAGLWIEMFWSHSGDDMDLHLLAPGGSARTNLDCYYGNCSTGVLDWGVWGERSDDPSLELNDIPGTGPEAIVLPEPEDGTFTVVVHDYPGSVYKAENDVTVHVYVHGLLAWSETRGLSGEDGYESFVDVSFPDGVVTGL